MQCRRAKMTWLKHKCVLSMVKHFQPQTVKKSINIMKGSIIVMIIYNDHNDDDHDDNDNDNDDNDKINNSKSTKYIIIINQQTKRKNNNNRKKNY